MALLRIDLNETYMAVEQALGANVGVDAVLWNIEGVISTGDKNKRVIYVPVHLPGAANGSQHQVVVVTILPKTSPNRHSATVLGTYASLDAAVTAAGAAILANTSVPQSVAVSAVANLV